MSLWLQLQFQGQVIIRRWWRQVRGKSGLTLVQGRTFPIRHPSTRLALQLLIWAQQELQPMALLDVGCGSGVLALFGAKLGIPWVVGCDLSRQAIMVSRDNALRNSLASQSCWLQGSTEALAFAFPLVVANLPITVQLTKQKEFLRLLARPGGLVLAGFREPQEGALRQYYCGQGLRLVKRLDQEAWEPEPPIELSYTWVGLYFRWD